MLTSGEFDDEVEDFHVIDCRYPYEFEGGHIQVRLRAVVSFTLHCLIASMSCSISAFIPHVKLFLAAEVILQKI